MVAGLVALMGAFATTQRAVLHASQIRLRDRRAEFAAESAMARALAVIQGTTTNLVSQSDEWKTLGDGGNVEFTLDNSSFRMEILDAGSRLNINVASEQQLQQLPVTQQQIDCLLDWREPGTQPRSDGAKDEYYRTLPTPYNTKLGRVSTLSELLLIRSWTASSLYSIDSVVTSPITLPTDTLGNRLPLVSLLTAQSGTPTAQANGSVRLNLNQPMLTPNGLRPLGVDPALRTQIILRAPIRSFQALLSLPGVNNTNAKQLLDIAGFSNATRNVGKINLNTASVSVLETIPGITPAVASAIVGQQPSGFKSLGDLTTVSGLTTATIAQVADSVTVGSDTWIVRAYGVSNGTAVAIEAVVQLINGRAQVQILDRLNKTEIPTWWGWQTEATQAVDIVTNR